MEVTMLRADVQEDCKATMTWFLNGLQFDIAEWLELQPYMEIGGDGWQGSEDWVETQKEGSTTMNELHILDSTFQAELAQERFYWS
mgnify:CR=1 FL=1